MKSSAPKHPEGTTGTQGTEPDINELPCSPGTPSEGTQGTALPTVRDEHPLDIPPEQLVEPEIKRPGYMTHDDWFAVDGQRSKPGLYYHGYGKASGGNDLPAEDAWVCTPIHAIAMTADERDNAHGLRLRFISTSGYWREWSVPMRLLNGSGEELCAELLDMGMRINPRERRRLIDWLMNAKPPNRLIAASSVGWHQVGDGIAFVMPDQTLGSEQIFYQSEHVTLTELAQAGSLNEWRDQVATPCVGNPVLLLAVSVAFAGPLLRIAKQQQVGGAGIHLMGNSSQGKTTALQVAASAWGAPAFVRTWRATANGLEGAAAMLNDTLLALDEISECDPREIGLVVYALANGGGKQRAGRSGALRPSNRWRNMVLSSGERSLEAHMGEAGKRPKAGQEARFFGIPATDQAHGAFDDLHGHEDGRAFADTLKQASSKHFGHAGPAFVQALIDDGRDFPAEYAEACDLPGFASNEGVESRVASYFALVGMAGELAMEYGLTGWPEGSAMDAALWAFEQWKRYRGSGQTEQRQILRAVRDFIEKHGDSRFSARQDAGKKHEPVVHNRAGYHQDDSNGRVYLFSGSGLREATSGFDLRQVIAALRDAGWLVERDTDKSTKKVRIGKATNNLYAIRPVGGGEE